MIQRFDGRLSLRFALHCIGRSMAGRQKKKKKCTYTYIIYTSVASPSSYLLY